MLIIFYASLQALEITLLKFKVDYFNPKYIKFVNITMKKFNRHSPYYINFEADTLDVAGNNVTVG